MRFIEPDLLTTVIPTHAEKYANQSKPDCVARMTSYEHAFMVFEKAAADVAQEYRVGMEKVRDAAKDDLGAAERRIDESGK